VILHPRSDWQTPDVVGRWQRHTWQDPTKVVGIAWHYPGAPHLAPQATDAETAQLIRDMDAEYVRDRGYNLGYNFVIADDGDVWVVRGLTDKCAANGNATTNERYLGVLFVTHDLTTPPNGAQLAAARDLVGYVRRWSPSCVTLVGHRDLFPTTCPGDRTYALVKSLEPDAPPTFTIANRPEDEPMQVKFRHPAYANVFVLPDGMPETPGVEHELSALPITVEDHVPVLAACCHRSWGITAGTATGIVEAAEAGGFLVRSGPPQ